jgi:hypothetical protein
MTNVIPSQHEGAEQLAVEQRRGAVILDFPTPDSNGGVFLDDRSPGDEPPVTANKVHEAYGEVAVGRGRTYYKGYFPEDRYEMGLGYIFPGFGGFLKSSEALGKALAEAGLATLIIDPSRLGNSVWEDLSDPQRLHVETAEAVFADLPNNTRVTKKMPDGRQVVGEQRVLTAHSMGGLAAPEYAVAHPDEVEMLALLKTVGINKSIMGRFMKSVFNGDAVGAVQHELLPYLQSDDIEISWKNLFRVAHYFGIPVPGRTDTRVSKPIGEMISCLRSDTRGLMHKLGEVGTKRLFVEGGRDVLIESADDIHDYIDMYVLLAKYGHMAPQRKAKLVARTILNSRQQMNVAA